jgi:hypothetical protein
VVLNFNDGAREGVFCIDVVVIGSNTVAAQAEALCQTQPPNSIPMQCSNIDYSFTLWTTGMQVVPTVEDACGHANGPCPSGTTRFTNSTDSATVFAGCDEIWAVMNAGSQITLPVSGKVATLMANLGTPHVKVGPDC